MLRRNASIFSKDDLDMGKMNLVKHNIILTDPIPFKEKYRAIPPQMFSERSKVTRKKVGLRRH